MTRRLTLHIGAMKSGTSFIQNVLVKNRSMLADSQRLLFPGRVWRMQVSAVLDLVDRGGLRQPPLRPDGPWHRLASEVHDWPGDALISMEFLGPRRRRKIKIILDTYSDFDVHVVVTGRDLGRTIPAMWQESVQNGGTSTWPDYLESVRDRDGGAGPGQVFWKQQGLAQMSQRWSSQVGRDRFRLVTVPPPGGPSSLLWDRFCRAAGFDGSRCDLDVRSNPSIGAPSALVMRALNEELRADPLPRAAYQSVVKHLLAKRGLASREEPRLGLDADWVYELGAREISDLAALDLPLIGDLADLTPVPVAGVHTDEVSADAQLAAAVSGLAALVRHQGRRRDHPRQRPGQSRSPRV